MACNTLQDMTENYAKNMRKKSRDGKLAVEQTMVKVNRGSTSATSLSMRPNPSDVTDDRIKQVDRELWRVFDCGRQATRP